MKEAWKAWAGSLVRAVVAASAGCGILFNPPVFTFYKGWPEVFQWFAIAVLGLAAFYGLQAVSGYIRWKRNA
jgi:hypothetical protein